MDEPKPESTPGGTKREPTVQADASAEPPGVFHMTAVPPPVPRERSEHSVIMALPDAARAERIASMRRELADLQRQLIEAQQRIATELGGRADDAERFEALEARLQAKEVEAEQVATRAAALETELAGLKPQLESATEKAEELRRDVATRAAQIEEAQRQHRSATDTLATQVVALQEAKTLVETRDTELATRTTERDAAQAARAKLESELEEQRKLHREVTEKLEGELASVRDAKALMVTRDAELATMTSERDVLKGELEQARKELDVARTKVRDVAADLVRLGQALADGSSVAHSASDADPKLAAPPRRPTPPPPPPPRSAAPAEPKQVETILEVTAEPSATSKVRTGLLMLLGVVVGCAVTIAIMKGSSSSSTAAGYREDPGAAPSPVVAPVAAETAPVGGEAIADPSPAAVQPAPASDTVVNAEAKNENAARAAGETPPVAPTEEPPAANAKDGVIVLPQSAAGRRVFVDGKVVKVEGSRAVIPCGTRKVRIGSTGTERTLDVACGGETAIVDDKRDR